MWSKVSRKVAGRPQEGYVREGYRSSFTGKVRGMLRGMLRKSTGRNRSRFTGRGYGEVVTFQGHISDSNLS